MTQRSTDHDPGMPADEHLRHALRHAPDAGSEAPAHVSAQIIAAGYRAAAEQAPALPAAAAQRTQRPPWRLGASGALASVAMAGVIGLLWRGEPPPAVAPGVASEVAAAAPVASAMQPNQPQPAAAPVRTEAGVAQQNPREEAVQRERRASSQRAAAAEAAAAPAKTGATRAATVDAGAARMAQAQAGATRTAAAEAGAARMAAIQSDPAAPEKARAQVSPPAAQAAPPSVALPPPPAAPARPGAPPTPVAETNAPDTPPDRPTVPAPTAIAITASATPAAAATATRAPIAANADKAAAGEAAVGEAAPPPLLRSVLSGARALQDTSPGRAMRTAPRPDAPWMAALAEGGAVQWWVQGQVREAPSGWLMALAAQASGRWQPASQTTGAGETVVEWRRDGTLLGRLWLNDERVLWCGPASACEQAVLAPETGATLRRTLPR